MIFITPQMTDNLPDIINHTIITVAIDYYTSYVQTEVITNRIAETIKTTVK